MRRIEKALHWMLKIANDDTHGYDQKNRNSPDYDCSSLIGSALFDAGYSVSPYSWTGNLRKQLLQNGFTEIPISEERKPGDIFLSEKHHVVMCVDANTIVHASINEMGKSVGGLSGDQTGREICTRSFYTPKYGWDYHFRDGTEKEDECEIPRPDLICAKGYADGFDRDIAGLYVVNGSWVNVRDKPTTYSDILVCLPHGTHVRNYGYYTDYENRKWLYVKFRYGCTDYIGFMAGEYLKRCE